MGITQGWLKKSEKLEFVIGLNLAGTALPYSANELFGYVDCFLNLPWGLGERTDCFKSRLDQKSGEAWAPQPMSHLVR